MNDKSRYIKITDLPETLPGDVDYFITSASYENRCLLVANEVNNLHPKNVIVCCNMNHHWYNGKNLEYLKILFGDSFSLLELNSKLPSQNNDTLLVKIISIAESNPEHIVIDITTFTHETLLILFRLLYTLLPVRTKVSFIYLEASDYSWNIDNIEEKWLSKGIGEIRSIIGYPGIFNPSRNTHLIILVGFESDRTIKLIERYDSTIVSLGLGIKSTPNPNNQSIMDIARKKHELLVNQFPHVKVFNFCLETPFDTKESIAKQIALYPDTNIVIAAMNNKISTIGAGMLAINNFEIQLCYVMAYQYNTEYYSKPSADCCIFDLVRSV